jgi:hypothetical protein
MTAGTARKSSFKPTAQALTVQARWAGHLDNLHAN